MKDFSASFTDLTRDFAGVAGSAMTVSALFDFASSDRRNKNDDPELRLVKPLLKMGLAGMLMRMF
jgi:hypothetical protein